MMCISLYSYGRPLLLFDVWGFGWVWVGLGHGSISSPGNGLLGWVSYLVGWVGSMKIDPRTTLTASTARFAKLAYLILKCNLQ